jgi:18S rRNA (adenine1779-N6/adenine1780-N6)-dimethyltransferase
MGVQQSAEMQGFVTCLCGSSLPLHHTCAEPCLLCLTRLVDHDHCPHTYQPAASSHNCCCTQALEQNYITFKALSLGQQQQQQQQAAAGSIAALGGSDPQPAAAAMDVSDAEDDDSGDEAGDMCLGSSGMAVDGGEAAAAAAGSSGGSSGRRGKSKVSPEFKELVMNVLIQNGFEQMRPAKMTQEDFLKLLADFNAAGIHFS